MKKFSLKDVCRGLVIDLQNLKPQKSRLKLSMDIQLPDIVEGNSEKLTSPIMWLFKWLNSRLINGLILIDVVKRSKLNDDLILAIVIAGLGTKEICDPDLLVSAIQFGLLQHPDIRVKADEDRITFEFNVQFKVRETPAPQASSLSNKSILIAEDNEINSLVFSGFMEEWGCDITTVENGREAIDRALLQPFDLILMDIHMPVMNGNEAIRAIRRENPDIPIIALTASTLESDIKESLESGANDYLLKPVASKTLYSVLQKYLTSPRSLV